MREARIRIVNEKGLHTRPSTALVQLAKKFESDIEVRLDGVTADGKSIMGLLALGAKHGSEVIVRAEGSDEGRALTAIVSLIGQGIPEEAP